MPLVLMFWFSSAVTSMESGVPTANCEPAAVATEPAP